MLRRVFIGVALLIPFCLTSSAQQGGRSGSDGLIGTWMLIALQRPGNGPEPATVPNPRGMLVFDRAGHALEIATRGGRAPNAANQATPAEAQVTFSNYGGFWGGYRVDEQQRKITYRPEGAVNSN